MKKTLLVFLFLLNIIMIRNVYAETYDGEYSTEYLLRNYNVVALGVNDNNMPDTMSFLYNSYYGLQIPKAPKGDLRNIANIDGAVLINGDVSSYAYYGDDYLQYFSGTYGLLAGNTKSYIKGTMSDDITYATEVVTDSNYVDFNRMYNNVLLESYSLANQTEYHINSAKLEVSKPGIYTIDDTAGVSYNNDYTYKCNNLLIKNYDRNSIYVFNYYNEYIEYLPGVMIMESGSSNAIPIWEFIESGNYTGNIIWNFPNAKLVSDHYTPTYCLFSGHVIAPNAYVSLMNNYYASYSNNIYYYGTIIANSISGDYVSLRDARTTYYLKKANYALDKQLLEDVFPYCEKAVDYSDDFYTGGYSIKDLLQNYSLLTLGNKQIDSKSKLLEFGNTPGSVRLFHITGQALIAGDLYGKVYDGIQDDYFSSWSKYDRVVFDMESNKVCESYIAGEVFQTVPFLSNSNNTALYPISYIQHWDNMMNDNVYYFGKKNMLLVARDISTTFGYGTANFSVKNFNNYINFDRLYENIVAEQNNIEEGKKVNSNLGKAHIKIGGNYLIEDINSIDEIIFDDFDKEKDELTIITIKNNGDINFPLISKDTGSYKGIVTNDYYGKEKATHLYEVDTFINEDSYHGNIVWNVPNATYIKLKENAPFVGHLIAPNADVDTPELQFAGCFIVNSIYGEGNTEAHFYPITVKPKCDCQEYHELSESKKNGYSEYRLNELLGGDKSIIEKTVLGNEEEYQADISNYKVITNKCNVAPLSNGSITEILTNPKTYRKIGLIVLLLVPFAYLLLKKKNKLVK